MRIRLSGTDTECAAAVAALAAGFVLREVSGFYPNRGATVLGRVYVDAQPRDGRDRCGVAGRDAGPFGATEVAQRDALAARLAGIDAALTVRTARKAWDCTCAAGRNALPSCIGEPIAPGELHVEYLGEAPAYSWGTRYHAACALETWSWPGTDQRAVVDLDGLAGTGGVS